MQITKRAGRGGMAYRVDLGSDPRTGRTRSRTFRSRVATARRREPGVSIAAWTMDEHRWGRKPILRRVWAWRGRRPVVAVRPRYAGLWVDGFVRPATGETWWLVLPRVNIAALMAAMMDAALSAGA